MSTLGAYAWHALGILWSLAALAFAVFVGCCVVGDWKRKRAQQRADVERARYLARQFFAATSWTPADETAARVAYLRSTP